ncbi:MAG: hypothetical protein ACI83I_001424 [Bacteroidia bacterium]|jgi:hypothetical protein
MSVGGGTTLQQNLIHHRINFRYQADTAWNIGLELRNRVFYGEFLKHLPGYGDGLEVDPGMVDLSWSWINNKELVAHTAIDRMWVNYSKNNWDIRLGRQRINWGQNIVWNPNDLFNVLNFADFDYEERPGSDAFKLQRYFKNSSNLQLAYKFTQNSKNQVIAGLYQFNKRLYDFQILAGRYNHDVALGVGWAGNIKNAGFKGEATFFEPMWDPDSSYRSVISSISIDFIPKKGPYILTSLLYNSSGIGDLDRLLTLSPSSGGTLDVKQLMPNKYSAFVQASGPINPLISGSLAAILALDMNGYFLMPSIDISVKQNLDLSLVGQSFIGKRAEWESLGSAVFVRFKLSY